LVNSRSNTPSSTQRRDALGISSTLYPFEGKFLTLKNGVQMHYLDEGPRTVTGPSKGAVVMVHGNPTWSFYYRDVVRALQSTHRCIVPDHIGMGLSDKPSDDVYSYTLAQRVEDLDTLIRSTVPEGPITLIMHDWGGMIGTAWAVKNPDRVVRIVALNTAAFRLPESKSFPWPLALTRTPLGAVLVRGGNAFSRVASHVCVKRGALPKAVRRAYTAPYHSWQDRIATLRFVQDIPLRESDDAYRVVHETEQKLHLLADKPMLLAFGLQDFVFDKHFLETWERHFPKAEALRFPDSGHYILEDQREVLLPRIRSFVG
jgi:pimeloyl-ACP methyl ester carboxylesterase